MRTCKAYNYWFYCYFIEPSVVRIVKIETYMYASKERPILIHEELRNIEVMYLCNVRHETMICVHLWVKIMVIN